MAREYQGHKNWNHWNVALWLNNDPMLYRAMTWSLWAAGGDKDTAARALHHSLTGDEFENTLKKTPDGAPYSISAIRAAMRGLDA